MSTIVIEIYDALREAGASEEKAKAAAAAIVGAEARTELATKVDIAEVKTIIANTKSELIMWNIGTALGIVALVIAALKLL